MSTSAFMSQLKPIQNTLLQFAAACSEFAYVHRSDANLCSDTVVLSIDCADLCRQMAVLSGKDIAPALAIARAFVRNCDKLLAQLSYCSGQSVQPFMEVCANARRCCLSLLSTVAADNAPKKNRQSATVCYGIVLPAGV